MMMEHFKIIFYNHLLLCVGNTQSIPKENPLQYFWFKYPTLGTFEKEKCEKGRGWGRERVRRPATLICPDTFRIATHSQDLISSSKSPLR